MKRILSFLLVITLLMTTMLAGCGQKSPSSSANQGNSSNANSSTNTTTDLTLWTFVGLHAQMYNAAAKRWNETYPNQKINLKVVTYPYEDMHNKLLVALQSGVGVPDIADIELGRFPQFLKGTPQLADLTDLVAQDKDKYIQSRLELYSKDGKLYGLPTHGGAVMAFYNKDILDKAGIDPSTIKTWDDFVAAGKTVKEKTGKPMLAVSQTAMWEFNTMIGQQGSDYFDQDGNVILDNDTNIKTLQFLHDMIYKDQIAVIPPGGQPDTTQAYGWIDKGNVAAVVMPFWFMSRFVSYMSDLKGKIIVEAVPVWKDGNKYPTVGQGGTGTVVPLAGKHVDLAKKFLAFAKETKEANLEIWNTLGFDPPRWDVWPQLATDPGDNQYTQYFVNGKDIFKILYDSTKGNIVSLRSTQLSVTANDLMANQVLYKVLKANSATAEQALKAAANELRKDKNSGQ
ncbi:sugar ABC transporter substrate-binding protein [Thermoanaerobacterium thermosaccharolyticum]|jgi:arabinosaccharide transport system substrate-binding protein|uniref:ABC transporter substrate-binding protein n=1 Tax=Thermoanaerobacterium thermosaccharolyticum TaxID=1517 RepID=UPI003D28C032